MRLRIMVLYIVTARKSHRCRLGVGHPSLVPTERGLHERRNCRPLILTDLGLGSVLHCIWLGRMYGGR